MNIEILFIIIFVTITEHKIYLQNYRECSLGRKDFFLRKRFSFPRFYASLFSDDLVVLTSLWLSKYSSSSSSSSIILISRTDGLWLLLHSFGVREYFVFVRSFVPNNVMSSAPVGAVRIMESNNVVATFWAYSLSIVSAKTSSSATGAKAA